MDSEDKYWSEMGQGHRLDLGWTYRGQSLDMGQSLDKLLMTNIGNQHRELQCSAAADVSVVGRAETSGDERGV